MKLIAPFGVRRVVTAFGRSDDGVLRRRTVEDGLDNYVVNEDGCEPGKYRNDDDFLCQLYPLRRYLNVRY